MNGHLLELWEHEMGQTHRKLMEALILEHLASGRVPCSDCKFAQNQSKVEREAVIMSALIKAHSSIHLPLFP